MVFQLGASCDLRVRPAGLAGTGHHDIRGQARRGRPGHLHLGPAGGQSRRTGEWNPADGRVWTGARVRTGQPSVWSANGGTGAGAEL